MATNTATEFIQPEVFEEGQECYVETLEGSIVGPFIAGCLFQDGNGNLNVTTSAPGHPTEWTPFDMIRVEA